MKAAHFIDTHGPFGSVGAGLMLIEVAAHLAAQGFVQAAKEKARVASLFACSQDDETEESKSLPAAPVQLWIRPNRTLSPLERLLDEAVKTPER